MKRQQTLRFVYALLLAYSSALPVMAQKPSKPAPPTPDEEWRAIEGKWHLLLAHEADANLTDRPEYKNSSVTISDKQFQWSSADGKPLFSAACNWKHVGKPAWEVDLTPTNPVTLGPGQPRCDDGIGGVENRFEDHRSSRDEHHHRRQARLLHLLHHCHVIGI